MLRYRALLVDTEGSYERPVQTLCNSVESVDDWARKILVGKGKHAYVVVYRVIEMEIGKIDQSAYDKSSVSRLQSASEKASEPASGCVDS